MDPFPITARDFYAKRDDRTNRCAEAAYQTAHCVVTSDVRAIETFSGQVMLLAALNLLSRWCRRVSIVIPDINLHQEIDGRSPKFADFVLSQMCDADPFGAFEIIKTPPPDVTIQLHAGENMRQCASRSVVISASGWLASISRNGHLAFPATDSPNFFGALAAACFGVAQVFKFALGSPDDDLIADGVFDLFTLSRAPSQQSLSDHDYIQSPELGKVLMVGAGSVASAAAYCLGLMNPSCELAVVDRDRVKVENFNRSPIFGKRTYGLPKADALVAYLESPRIIVTAHNMWWDDFIRAHGRPPNRFDLWLPLANEFGVRWSMQNNYPPLLVHASTTNNWGVNHGRHRFGRDDCLADRFPSELPQTALRCSSAEVGSETERVDAALPFLSMFAGALVVAELARLQLPEYPQCPNFALIDFGGDVSGIQAWDRKPRSTCLCQTQSATIHKTFNGGTKYFD